MRLWSLHPRYLDQPGLCGLWRESIMAKNALKKGKEHGYWKHPQLERFKKYEKQNKENNCRLNLIDSYLAVIYRESMNRGYNFDKSMFSNKKEIRKSKIPVTEGQIQFELAHLKRKLRDRDSDRIDLITGKNYPRTFIRYFLL